MASPQKENGYIPIANEIVDKLSRYRISGQEYQVLWVVLRKTWGWNKKTDNISLSQLSKFTEMKRSQVCRAINKLVSKKVLTSIKKGTTDITNYSFNKDYESWIASPKKDTTSPQKDTRLVPKKGTILVPKKIHTKDNKDIITKDILSASADEINQILDIFYKINPNINYGNKTSRKAIDWMINKYGIDDLIVITKYACSVQSEQYAPTITTPYQLKEKMAQLKIYHEKQKGQSFNSSSLKL